MDENKALFFDVINEAKISAVFILDFHKTFFTSYYNHDYQLIPFDLKWLEEIKIPINVIDYLDVLDYNQHNQLYLTNSDIYNAEDEEVAGLIGEEKNELYEKILDENRKAEEGFDKPEETPKEDMVSKTNIFPDIIKLCPPNYSQKDTEFARFIYLNYGKTDFTSPETEQMKAPLGMTEGKKNVLLFFSFQFILKSTLEAKQPHYVRVMNSIIIYLKKLDIDVNLFVIGSDTNFGKNNPYLKGSKINYRAFKTLSYHIYRTLISYADLVIVDTTWHPALIDAAGLKIPTGVIGSSVEIAEDGSVISAFETTNLEVLKIMQDGIQEYPQTFFPFDSYPLKADRPPFFDFVEDKFLYYLLDIYSDECMVSFLGDFLVSQSATLETLNERQALYNKKADLAITINELLQKYKGL